MIVKVALNWIQRIIARCWIAPLDTIIWEMVGLDRSSCWRVVRATIVWVRDLGRLVYTGFRASVSRWDGSEWSVIYISDGSYGRSVRELQYLLFSGAPTGAQLGRVFIWQIPALVRRYVSRKCLVICDANRLLRWRFRGMYCIRALPWQRALLDVSGSMDSIAGRMRTLRKRDLSKAQKLGLEYCVSDDLADFELFYHKMYAPYIGERYVERAFIHSYEDLQKVFKKRGKLLCIKYQDDLVAAYFGTYRRYGSSFSALLMGVHQDYTRLVERGVVTALYWYVTSWAHANELSNVDFGRVRARLNDGLFGFKRQMGVWFERDILTHTVWTFVYEALPLSLVRRLNELAFIAEVGKEYQCVILDGFGVVLSDKELARRTKIADQAGLGLFVLRPYDDRT